MRARLELRVKYDAPARHCGRVLRILPLPRPSLELLAERVEVFPSPNSQVEELDSWNNRRLRVSHRRIENEFRLHLEVEARFTNQDVPVESLNGQLKMPSRVAPFTLELLAVARDHRTLAPLQRAERLNRFVFESLQYSGQTNEHPENATHIWNTKRGSCADFAHVLLVLCRASGLAARYVAGFGPAPGALHAWVEVAIAGDWHAFDPTHGREAVGLYLPVATGRDFYDCAPHQGRFLGRGAHLELKCELNEHA